MSKTKEWLLDSSIILIWGDLEYENLREVVDGLHNRAALQPDELTISINSSGGDFNLALGLFDLIRLISGRGTKIITVCFGEVSSGAILLAAAGDQRLATPNTSFCVHSVFDEETQETDYPETLRYLSLIEARTGLSAERALAEMQTAIDNEWNFNSKTALEIGLLTKIWEKQSDPLPVLPIHENNRGCG